MLQVSHSVSLFENNVTVLHYTDCTTRRGEVVPTFENAVHLRRSIMASRNDTGVQDSNGKYNQMFDLQDVLPISATTFQFSQNYFWRVCLRNQFSNWSESSPRDTVMD